MIIIFGSEGSGAFIYFSDRHLHTGCQIMSIQFFFFRGRASSHRTLHFKWQLVQYCRIARPTYNQNGDNYHRLLSHSFKNTKRMELFTAIIHFVRVCMVYNIHRYSNMIIEVEFHTTIWFIVHADNVGRIKCYYAYL